MTKPKTVKPKRQREMWAVIGNVMGMNGVYFDTIETAEYYKNTSKISKHLTIKKVLVTEL